MKIPEVDDIASGFFIWYRDCRRFNRNYNIFVKLKKREK